ncbi:hypothetical protein BU16DRAFT_542858 [Lophium mytilinum]|uniref:Zn(2)-C6 fungal-type domain-containing protein n=1 Tax=Lophium mytilinum TaxID=390894 RepID=A0A6A6QK43_9PEZI|nr:hypothetical protein BU16DRAFT_542858 [Lophium mytilinum]
MIAWQERLYISHPPIDNNKMQVDTTTSKRKGATSEPATGSKKQRTTSKAVRGQAQPTSPPGTAPLPSTKQLPAAPPSADETQCGSDAATKGKEEQQPNSALALPAYLGTMESKVAYLKSLAGRSWEPSGMAAQQAPRQRTPRGTAAKSKSKTKAAPKQAVKVGKKAATGSKARQTPDEDEQAALLDKNEDQAASRTTPQTRQWLERVLGPDEESSVTQSADKTPTKPAKLSFEGSCITSVQKDGSKKAEAPKKVSARVGNKLGLKNTSCVGCYKDHRKCSGGTTSIWPCEVCLKKGIKCRPTTSEPEEMKRDEIETETGSKAEKTVCLPKAVKGGQPNARCAHCSRGHKRCSGVTTGIWPCEKCDEKNIVCERPVPKSQPQEMELDELEIEEDSGEEGGDEDESQDDIPSSSEGAGLVQTPPTQQVGPRASDIWTAINQGPTPVPAHSTTPAPAHNPTPAPAHSTTPTQGLLEDTCKPAVSPTLPLANSENRATTLDTHTIPRIHTSDTQTSSPTPASLPFANPTPDPTPDPASLEARISTASGAAETLCDRVLHPKPSSLYGVPKARYDSLEARRQAAKAEAWALVWEDVLQVALENEGMHESEEMMRIQRTLERRTARLEESLRDVSAVHWSIKEKRIPYLRRGRDVKRWLGTRSRALITA